MDPITMKTALKEWAATVKAIDEGKQVLLLRKGGIREEGKEFRVLHRQFLLYPTYEHQQENLLKPAFHTDLAESLLQQPPEGTVTLTHWAEVTDLLEVHDQAKVDTLSPLYIWTTDYAQKRLHWKPRKPLTIMLVRAYRLAQRRTVPVLPEYGGCKSWVELAEEVALGNYAPVLSEEAYRQRVEAVRERLDLAAARS